MELSVRSYLNAGIALTAASTIALAPVTVAPSAQPHISLPRVTAAEIHLAAAINPADVTALVANLAAAMGSVTSTVTGLLDGTTHTLSSALHTAAGLNSNLWDGLIRSAGTNPTLASVLIALKAASNGGLTELALTIDAAGQAISLTTGQLAGLLTTTVTGSLGAAMQAVTSVINDPLSAASYLGLLTTPFGIAGLALQNGITAVSTLATGGVSLASALVTGVTDQIGNGLSLVNDILAAGKTLTDIALIDGALTALQGIVSAPVTAALAAVTGVTTGLTDAAAFTLRRVAGGAAGIVDTWLGDHDAPGALQKALTDIGSAPLSPASYTNALGVLIGAGVTTVTTVVGTASSFASLPFRLGADLTVTAAEAITSFTSGLATAASGLLHAVGLPGYVSSLPHALATAVSGAVNLAAFTTSTALNAIATTIDIGQAIGGIVTARTSAVTAGPSALPTAAQRTAMLDTRPEQTPGSSGAAEVETVSTAAVLDSDTTAPAVTAESDLPSTAVIADPKDTAGSAEPEPDVPTDPDTAGSDGLDQPGDTPPAEAGDRAAAVADQSVDAEAAAGDDTSPTGDTAQAGTADAERARTAPITSKKRAAANRDRPANTSASTEGPDRPDSTSLDSDAETTHGRHASGATSSTSSSSVGRHRAESAAPASTTTPGVDTNEKSARGSRPAA